MSQAQITNEPARVIRASKSARKVGVNAEDKKSLSKSRPVTSYFTRTDKNKISRSRINSAMKRKLNIDGVRSVSKFKPPLRDIGESIKSTSFTKSRLSSRQSQRNNQSKITTSWFLESYLKTIEIKEKNIMTNRPKTRNEGRRVLMKQLSSHKSIKHTDYTTERTHRVQTAMGSRNHNLTNNQFEKSIG